MTDFFRFKTSTFVLAASIAATWVWAPAIFVSSNIAHTKGIVGLLWFLIPNALTLVLFGYLVSKVQEEYRSHTFKSLFRELNGQKRLHAITSLILLVCSTVVQLIGIHTLLSEWFGLSKIVSCIGVSATALALVYHQGLKSCILTDVGKYCLMLMVGVVCAILSYTGTFNVEGVASKGILDTTLSFGLITAIGLLSAPYVDQTFWQRVFCIDRDKIVKTFSLAAIMFAVIPLLFGLCGIMATGDNWTIATAFKSPVMQCVLGIGVFSALLSTLDSNLCAISSLAYSIKSNEKDNIYYGRISMFMLLALSSIVFLATDITITALFLLYGTIRTCAAIPTILVILKRFSATRLFYSTLLAMVLAPLGYALSAGTTYQWCFTMLGLILPLLGYRSNYGPSTV